MSVVVIGDRAVGKTSMVLALADSSRSQHVKIVSPDPEGLRSKYRNPKTGRPAPTEVKREETLTVNVNLPSGGKPIQVRWVDTPGEAWESKDWRMENPSAWLDFLKEVSESQGIILLLPPHDSLVQPHLLASSADPILLNELKTPTQWKNYLGSWLDFFHQHCSKVKHIIICIHKADLCCDIQAEGKKWRFDPLGSTPWFEYNNYVRQTYFMTAKEPIFEYNSRPGNRRLNFFITTTQNRALLELPWIYLAGFIAHS